MIHYLTLTFKAGLAFFFLPYVAWTNAAVLDTLRNVPDEKLRSFKYNTIWLPASYLATVVISFGCVWYAVGLGLFMALYEELYALMLIGDILFSIILSFSLFSQTTIYPPAVTTCGSSNSSAVLIVMSNATGGLKNNPPSNICANLNTAWGMNFGLLSLMLFMLLTSSCGSKSEGSFRLQPGIRAIIAIWELSFAPFKFLFRVVVKVSCGRKRSNELKKPSENGIQTRCRSQQARKRVRSNSSDQFTPHKESIVELQEIHVIKNPGTSLFENFMDFDDIFIMVCQSSHGSDIQGLARVSKRCNSIIKRYKESGLLTNRTFICNVNDYSSCGRCKIRTCSSCSVGGPVHVIHPILSFMRRLAPICSLCYFRSLCPAVLQRRPQPVFASTWKTCRCGCYPQILRFCLTCETPCGSSNISAQQIQEEKELENYRYDENCFQCDGKFWPWSLRWWYCPKCRLEDRRVAL